ncbi:MAG: DUF3553 domain-containing protein [Proteobacteria bacterium]|nr:DUF3553 domain-containing protein [Pseudomonadota bacterium]
MTVRPGEELWLVGVLVDPKFDGQEWMAAPSDLPIVDITHLRDKLRFATGKGIAGGVSLGAALQTPRAISELDRKLLDDSIARAGAAAPPTTDGTIVVNRRPGDEERMFHHLERAKSGRSACDTCAATIAKGDVRLAEVYMHGDIRTPIYRYHHVPCATTAVPLVLRNALTVLDATSDLAPDRARLLAETGQALDAQRVARRDAFSARIASAQVSREQAIGASAELLAQLDDHPDDPGILEVLADELQARGDPRGELITVQRALAAHPRGGAGARAAERRLGRIARDERVAPVDEASQLAQRSGELIAQLTPQLDAGDRCTWTIGFVRRLELVDKSAERIDEIATLWQHPSLRMLRELRLAWSSARACAPAIPTLVEVLPRTLRRLELGHSADHFLGKVSEVLAALPRLDSLALAGHADFGELAHPTLRRLELVATAYTSYTQAITRLDPRRLPALRSLKLEVADGVDVIAALLAGLAEPAWFTQLDELALATRRFDETVVVALEVALHARKLPRLDLTGSDVPLKLRPRLAKLCVELGFPLAASIVSAEGDQLSVEHTAKPEWGVGKIVKRHDGKLEVKFPTVGIKVFKADAPFLKLS